MSPEPRPSRIRQQLHDRIREVAADGSWTVVNATTVVFTDQIPFPAHMRSWPGVKGGFPYRDWGPTADRHVFVTATSAQPIIGVSRGPWTPRVDSMVSIRRALEILADPVALLDRSG